MKSVSKLVFLALLIPVMGLATISGPPPPPPGCGADGTGCDYHYAFTLTGLSGGKEDLTNLWTFSFDWVGPYRASSPPNSLLGYGETGSPKAGWTSGGGNGSGNGTTFGSYIPASFSANSSSDVFLEIYFQDLITTDANYGSAVDYHLTGTDAFWATLGLQTFASTNAYSTISGTDPPCTACTVTITATPLATPEPASFLLLGTIAMGLGFGLRKRVKRSTTI